MEVTIVVGNPRVNSRTRAVAEAVASRVAAATGARVGETIELSELAGGLFTWPHEEVDAVLRRVGQADLLVIASPTYKATYTGLLKAFLDRYGDGGLAGVTAVPVMTGGSAHHALAVDTGFRGVLVELGASVPTRGLYFIASEIDRLDEIVDGWARTHLKAPGLLGAAPRPT